MVALFTSTPIDESLDVIRERLEQNQEWKYRYTTLLETDDVMELLEFILSITYFSFRNSYNHVGSLVSPLVANMFMEHLEEKLLATAPRNWDRNYGKRYVDILEVVRKGSVEELTEFVNKLDESGSVKFTYEVEQEGRLPFLDLLLVWTYSCR